MADKLKRAVNDAKMDATRMIGNVKSEAVKAMTEAKEQIVRPAVERARERSGLAIRATRKSAKMTAEKASKKAAQVKGAVEHAARKAVARELAPIAYVQYMGGEKKVDDLVAAATGAFAREHPRTKVTDLRLYIKPEDRAAYYVINEKFAGRVDF